jgi:hypothetical protein
MHGVCMYAMINGASVGKLSAFNKHAVHLRAKKIVASMVKASYT